MQHLPFRSKRTKTNSKTKVKQRIIKKRNQKKNRQTKKEKAKLDEKKLVCSSFYAFGNNITRTVSGNCFNFWLGLISIAYISGF